VSDRFQLLARDQRQRQCYMSFRNKC
jgi:hypothetical protein